MIPGRADGSSRRLLLIGINYAPEETGIAPYTTELAEHLVARGWQVTILTGMPHYPQWEVLEQYRRSLRTQEIRNGVALRRLRHYVPSCQSAFGRAIYEATFLLQAATTPRLARPDCVVGVVPSLGGGVAAALHAQRHGVPFGVVVQDLLGQAACQSGIPAGRLAAGPVQAIEGWVFRRAAGVAVVADSFRPHLEEVGVRRDRISTLPNWTHLPAPSGRWRDLRHGFGWSDDQTVVLHAGNMGYKQHLDNVVEAARLAADEHPRLRFILLGHGTERPRLETLATDLPNVQFLDLQPAELFIDVLAAADVLVVNERPSVRDMSLPSKLTSYFRAGRPVVAAVHPEGATAAALNASGGALLVPPADAAAFVDAVQRLTDDRELRRCLVAQSSVHARASFDRGENLQRAEQFVAGLVPQQEVACSKLARQVRAATVSLRRRRRLTGRKPDFVIIGAQKSASTFLAHTLNRHPDIYIPPRETHYFRDPEYLRESPASLLDLFAGNQGVPRIGIKSADYLARPECPARLHRDLDDPQLLVVLRHPVDRAVSAYFWYLRWNCLPLAPAEVGLPRLLFGEYSDTEFPRGGEILDWGLYSKHLSRYLEHFSREKLFVALDYEMQHDTLEVLRRALEFLDVDPAHAPGDVAARRNAGVYSLARLDVIRRRNTHLVPRESARTAMTIRLPHHPVPLLSAATLDLLDRWVLARRHENVPPTLPAQLIQRLESFYAEDIAALGDLLDRDLSSWSPAVGVTSSATG